MFIQTIGMLINILLYVIEFFCLKVYTVVKIYALNLSYSDFYSSFLGDSVALNWGNRHFLSIGKTGIIVIR